MAVAGGSTVIERPIVQTQLRPPRLYRRTHELLLGFRCNFVFSRRLLIFFMAPSSSYLDILELAGSRFQERRVVTVGGIQMQRLPLLTVIKYNLLSTVSDLMDTPRALSYFNNDGQRVQSARPELPALRYIFMCRLLPTTSQSPSRRYYPDLSPVPIYRPRKDGELGALGHNVHTIFYPKIIIQLNSKAEEGNEPRLLSPRPTEYQ